ncbi:hypothetical protein MmTuc01_1536 [Methanosarcina mazei Tuc01]|uniref:Uncharacterized protein n=1 Tax=Methanosarcina mazei Tuc01 TaxID=1236903 RepID=M1Q3Q7_METMZ|nr:hypothetical protein MmTuc01_1536 [Methanosarcina mazei Tuc01]
MRKAFLFSENRIKSSKFGFIYYRRPEIEERFFSGFGSL